MAYRMKRDERYPVRGLRDSFVEFNYPNPDGRPFRAQILDISVAGLSFLLEEELPLVTRGAKLVGVRVLVGECEMRGTLIVKHSTRDEASGIFVGTLFHPDSDQDMLKLNGLIAGLSVQERP